MKNKIIDIIKTKEQQLKEVNRLQETETSIGFSDLNKTEIEIKSQITILRYLLIEERYQQPKKKYTKEYAIKSAIEFIKDVNELEDKYGFRVNSDTGDIYLSFKTLETNKVWDNIKLGWDGDGSGIKVTEEIKDDDYYRKQALSKLTEKERELLNLK